MSVLLDTNILLRLIEPSDPEYAVVRDAVKTLTMRGESLYFSPQNLVEFWNVCTRSAARNGLGLTPEETNRRALLIEHQFRLVPDNERVYQEWRRLVVVHAVSGVQVHDARIAAIMLTHGIGALLTLNGRDFARFTGVSIIHPREVVLSGL